MSRRLILALSAAVAAASPADPAWGQFAPSNRFELSDNVYVDEPESSARTHLEQVKAYLAAQQWDEAIDVLRTVAERYGDKLVPRPRPADAAAAPAGIVPYSNLRDYCQWRLAALPAEALVKYRQLVDEQAEAGYRGAIAARDRGALERLVEIYFCSSWGDDALLAWGDLALEAGDFAAARSAWQRIHPPAVLEPTAAPTAVRRLTYPDSDLPPADVAARLILVSILEPDLDRAQGELSNFTRLYPNSTGQLGGREVQYAGMLTSLLAASREWPKPTESDDWPTFAGAASRNRVVNREVDIGAVTWRAKLKPVTADEGLLDYNRRLGPFPDDRPRKSRIFLSYHPLLVDELLLVNTQEQILAFDRRTGKPAWNGQSEVIFREENDQFAGPQSRLLGLGAPRFTMTAVNRRLYARLGSPVTIYGNEMQRRGGPGYLVCLDLAAEGRLVWKIFPEFAPDDGKWTFEGAPLCDGEFVYVAVRHSDVRPQAHVACYEADSGRLRWIRYLCAAETPGGGQKDESTSNLLTLAGTRLYANTNLGAVAALDARDGQIEWLTSYRVPQVGDLGQPLPHFQRDLNPCVYYRGMLFVAPSDSESIYAFDAGSGDLIWESPHAGSAQQLLGVGSGNLIAAGDRLYWINVASGKLVQRWPDGPNPKGYGRGLLVGDQIVWPTREEIYLLSQQTGQMAKVIQLAAAHPGHTGGNLLLDDQSLYIAASDSLTCYSHYSQVREPPPLPAAPGK
ncbi:MAG: PQQ-like beta-propeller repeat protein [Planctomycetaceae bacterium]|nr:PQQ-like beta-propeller repeat protein [Planctomycetaceae bacterium]